MARRTGAGGTPATVALERAGVAFTRHAYEHDPAAASYGLEAAEALGLDPAAVFKTLLADVDGALAVGIVPVTGQLDLKALAAALGGKRAAMADPAAAERTTGYVVGGISPIGQKRRLPHRAGRLGPGPADDLRQRGQARPRPGARPARPGPAAATPRSRRSVG